MFGSSPKDESDLKSKSPSPEAGQSDPTDIRNADQAASGEKRSGNGSPPGRNDNGAALDKKRRSSGVSGKASSLLASAKNTLNFSQGSRTNSDLSAQTPLQKLGKQDPALAVPQGQHNNSAGESLPGPNSTFRVGVWEDRNKKCRRTMEDTHAFLYNFLPTPGPADSQDAATNDKSGKDEVELAQQDVVESDNGYFAIFDGHAGTFAADWCGKKLHILLEDIVRKNPSVPMPELLDQTFTSVDSQLEKLPVKNSGCTAAIAVLRWEDRVPSDRSATGSQPLAPVAAANAASKGSGEKTEDKSNEKETAENAGPDAATAAARLKPTASRQRVLYTANVGDARIVLCRSGKALRLSYDHKGSDEHEGRRIAHAGGLILNNRVNGVLAVTRALGDAYMKDLVTGHPYTTETVIQPESDEFVIIACDGIWDVCSDQEAVDTIRDVQDPVAASKILVDHALSLLSTDNLSCMVVRLDKEGTKQGQNSADRGAEIDKGTAKVSEVDKIVGEAKARIAEGSAQPVGVSPSNSGRGHDAPAQANAEDEDFVPTTIDGAVLEEEPSNISDSDDVDRDSGKQASAEQKKSDEGDADKTKPT